MEEEGEEEEMRRMEEERKEKEPFKVCASACELLSLCWFWTRVGAGCVSIGGLNFISSYPPEDST